MSQTVLLPVELIGKVSDRALILYALMADRAKSSAVRPQFIDTDGVPYVIFTVEEVQRTFGVGQCQARATIKELETAGLIVGKCQGMGQPKHYYIIETAGKSAVKTAGKSAVKTAGKSAVKTAGKSAPNQLDHNQSDSNQSSDDDTDTIKQIVDNYCKMPQFKHITPEIADFVAKNVKNAIKKRKIANIKAYIRTCLVSAPADYAAQLSFSTASASDNSGYPATYDINAYESVSAADSEILDEGEVIQ